METKSGSSTAEYIKNSSLVTLLKRTRGGSSYARDRRSGVVRISITIVSGVCGEHGSHGLQGFQRG